MSLESRTILQLISKEFPKAGIPPLLVGGFAVNFLGVQRATLDIDVMILAENLSKAAAILKEAGYREKLRSDLFVKMVHGDADWIDVDLLLADKETFDQLIKESREVTEEDVVFRVPKLEHFMAMKLHAMKNNPDRRAGKDLFDVLALVEAHTIDIRSETFRQLCLKFGNDRIYKRISAFFGGEGGR